MLLCAYRNCEIGKILHLKERSFRIGISKRTILPTSICFCNITEYKLSKLSGKLVNALLILVTCRISKIN